MNTTLPAKPADVTHDLGHRVQLHIQRLDYPQLRHVKCCEYEGCVTLSGTLTSQYLKSVAHSIAMKTPGVRGVRNDIDVIE